MRWLASTVSTMKHNNGRACAKRGSTLEAVWACRLVIALSPTTNQRLTKAARSAFRPYVCDHKVVSSAYSSLFTVHSRK